MATPARAALVESIPVGLDDLRGTPGVQYTEDVLVRLCNAATERIDLTAMYWALLPDPTSDDEKGFTDEQFAKMGAAAGRALFDALGAAAARGVKIRVIESPGFSGKPQESATLAAAHPDAVNIRSVTMGDWYGGGGIMHQKLWIFDGRHLYLGSANMDWKSISQVKEMGVVLEDDPELAADATRYYEGWWTFAGLPPQTVVADDPTARIARTVPAWSPLVPAATRAPSPLAGPTFAAAYHRKTPLRRSLNGQRSERYLSGAPAEVNGERRTWDGEALVETILDARRSVSVSVMDFAPVSLYGRAALPGDVPPTDTPVWWPALSDALLTAALTHKAHVRLLVSSWSHTSDLVGPLLNALQSAADAGRASAYMSSGQLEIKRFVIPGWDSTTGTRRSWPGHSRVNHTKYIVTDRRINIGTSNMTWDYFASTAGCSFNSDAASLVQTLQNVFDRDWASAYAWRLT